MLGHQEPFGRGARLVRWIQTVTGGGDDVPVMEITSLQFAAVVRVLSASARSRGLEVPSFRSPPRRPGFDRTIRRQDDGTAMVSVATKGRPLPAVVADLIEGLVLINELSGVAATRERTALWAAVVGSEASGQVLGAA